MDLSDLQMEHEYWVHRNFPHETTYQAFLGMVEEMGELAHAMLKSEQGIRGMSMEAARDAKIDAVGDLVIFLAGFCTMHGINLEEAVEDTWHKVKKRNWTKDPERGGEEPNAGFPPQGDL